MGCDCKNNAATPDTQFDLDADGLLLRDTNGSLIAVHNPGAAITNNVSTAGPAANGRDVSGAFSAASWVHLYWIYNPATSTLATISSATAPPTGPALPSGYTHWAYAGAVYFSAGSALVKTRIKGSTAYYEAAVSALATGVATVETAVPLTAIIPPNALSFDAEIQWDQYITAGPALRLVTGVDYIKTRQTQTGAHYAMMFAARFPNVSQNIYYIHASAPAAGYELFIFVTGYSLPNGGE